MRYSTPPTSSRVRAAIASTAARISAGGSYASTRILFLGASIAHAARTSDSPLAVWHASAGHRLNEPSSGITRIAYRISPPSTSTRTIPPPRRGFNVATSHAHLAQVAFAAQLASFIESGGQQSRVAARNANRARFFGCDRPRAWVRVLPYHSAGWPGPHAARFVAGDLRRRDCRVHLLFHFRLHVPHVGHAAVEPRREQTV